MDHALSEDENRLIENDVKQFAAWRDKLANDLREIASIRVMELGREDELVRKLRASAMNVSAIQIGLLVL